MGSADKTSAATLIDWVRGQAVAGAAHEAADLDRVALILGYRPADWRQADADLERHVLAAGPDQDLALFRYFAAQTEDLVAEAGSIQPRLAQYALPRITL
jgi:hypothetical protein